jgi:hypothetical protein
MADSNPLRDQIITAARECFQRSAATMLQRLDAFETRLKAITLTPGPKGDTGEKGIDGAIGKDGANGIDGKDGAPGVDGKDGAPGEKGEAGEAGTDGVDGEQGIQGEQGLPGERGEKGEAGTIGQKGLDGANGIDGAEGKAGEAGRDGRDGTPGEPGRDALEIDVRDGIDEAKAYPRGTFATHKGGMIRAFKATLPLKDADSLGAAGWQVIMNGIDDVQTAHTDDFRSLGLAVQTTDGKMFVIERSYPTMVYRGVFADGTYSKGDVVTWGGSAWHCQVEKTEAQPGTSDDWRLMVKSGQRGKDGAPGERGADGRAGKDLRP